MSLEDKIKKIPAVEDWWSYTNEYIFVKIAKELIERGFTEDEAVDILDTLYYTVADEFGV